MVIGPEIDAQITPREPTIAAGEACTLTCNASVDGEFSPNFNLFYKWYHAGRALPEDRNTLTCRETGEYICVVYLQSNITPVDNPISCGANVEVQRAESGEICSL